MSKDKQPKKKFTTISIQHLISKMDLWLDVQLLTYPVDVSAGQLYLRAGIDKKNDAQRSYIGEVVATDRLISFATADGVLPILDVSLKELPLPPAAEKPVIENGEEGAVAGDLDEEPIYQDWEIVVSIAHSEVLKFRTAGEASKTLTLQEVGNERSELEKYLKDSLLQEWSDHLAGIIGQIAAYREQQVYSKLAGQQESGRVIYDATPTGFQPKRAALSKPSAVPKKAYSSRGASGKMGGVWSWKKIILIATCIMALLYLTSVGMAYVSKKKSSGGAPNMGMVAPDEIGEMVAKQKAAIESGGTDPYSGIDTGNVQIETLKRMGIDVGKVDLGCLVEDEKK